MRPTGNSSRLLGVAALMAITISTTSEATEIVQQEFIWKNTVTRECRIKTFVIIDTEPSSGKKIPVIKELQCRLATVHFDIGTARLSPRAASVLLSRMRQYGNIIRPIQITGHTCFCGTEKANLLLSRQRAETVAALLREHGYTISRIEGEGSKFPATFDPGQQSRNRRVELFITE